MRRAKKKEKFINILSSGTFKPHKWQKEMIEKYAKSDAEMVLNMGRMMGKTSMIHEHLAQAKVWMTEEGDKIAYKDLKDSHLDNIINMLETKETNRWSHYEGLIEEKLRRNTELGKILYDEPGE